nr:zinc finger HIT domain-containing protein 1 isoform X1 [Manis javanica]
MQDSHSLAKGCLSLMMMQTLARKRRKPVVIILNFAFEKIFRPCWRSSLPDPLLVLDRFYLQVPEVDCVSLGIPGEEGPPCITPASERSSPKHEALLWTDRAIRLPNKAVSYLPRKTGLSSRDCVAGKWARPAECCCNKRSHARRRVWAACLITWCFHG